MEPLARGEEETERRRGPGWVQWGGRVLGPLLALTVHVALSGSETLSDAGRATAAVGVLMAVLWMTEALPLAATALLPIVLFPVFGVATIKQATAPYASDVIYLFLGGFMLALAMERWGLHRRVALHIVSWVGTRADRLVGGFMLASAFLSMWINNTATTMMMLPIAQSLAALVLGGKDAPGGAASDPAGRRFGTALLLAIAYASSIGSLATPIGTAPNLFLRGFVQRTYGIELGFAEWMAVCAPISLALLLGAWLLLTRVLFRGALPELPEGQAVIRRELLALGPWNGGEKVVGAVFVATAAAWILRGPLTGIEAVREAAPWIARLGDAGIAVAAALLLFTLPVPGRRGEAALDWKTAEGIPWGILVLIGGGLSLASAVQGSGLDLWLGSQVQQLGSLPPWLLVVLVVALVVYLTELTSNTATAATFVPVLGGVAVAIGFAPLSLLVPATLAATCAFMLPVGTPPNAIVFASGRITIDQMARAGFWLNLLAVAVIGLAAPLLIPRIFGG